ncbi:MAG: hypothetical protein IJK62_00250 [Bacteroidales bacterium]|nr:hypothetical protein [Bacteroidales bacterium]
MQYGRRNIVDGSKYNRFFGKPEETRKVVGDNSTEYNVSKLLPKWVAQCNWQTRKIADYLWDSNLEKFCHNIWKFLFSHIQYEYDDTGREQFRSPYRSWADRERGIDCDCFSIFVSCILTNKGIPHYFRITKYNGRDQWQHIYVIVPKRGVKFDPYDGDTYYTIDCVIHEFDTEKDFSDQKLQPMNGLGIITETLAGIDDTDAAQVLTGLILDGDEMSGDKDMIKLQLIATRNWVSENPKLYEVQNGKKADDFIKMCDYALQYWDNPQKREQALSVLEENERMQEAAINGLGTPQLRKQVFTKRIALVKAMPMKKAARPTVEFDEDDDFDGLGKSKAEKKAAKQQKKEAKKAQKAEKKAIKKQAKAEAKQERKEKREANKEELKNQQGFFNKLKTAVKQGAKAVFVDANPAVIAIRGAFLLVVKLNLFGIAKKLHPAYCDEATAKKMGYTAKQIDVAKKSAAATEKIFADKMGGTKAHLKEAVLVGYLKKAQGSLKGLAEAADGLGQLGVVTTAVTAASLMSALSVVVAVLKAIMKVEKDEGVEGLGSMEDEINRTAQLLQTTSVNDIIREMNGFSGLSGDEKAESASAIAKFIKAVIEKIKGAVNKKKAKKAEGSTETKKSASADGSATDTDGKKKGKFGEKVKNFVGKAKDFVQDKLAERQQIQQMQDEYASRSFDNGFLPSSNTPVSKSINTNSNNMGNEQKKGLPTWAKWTLGIAGVAIVGGGIAYGVHQHRKKSEAALQGWATRRRKASRKAKEKLQTVNL